MTTDNAVLAIATFTGAGIIVGLTAGLLLAWSQSRIFKVARQQARLETLLGVSTKRVS